MNQSPAWYPLPSHFRTLAAENRNAVLLETAKADSDADRSLLFLDPIRELIAWHPEDLDELLLKIDQQIARGFFVAGYFNYECGERFVGLESAKTTQSPRNQPLAWLGVFTQPIIFDHTTGTIRGELPQPTPGRTVFEEATIFTDGLEISKTAYISRIERIHEYLREGHTYQVNFTDRVRGSTDSAPLPVYETLLRQQPVPFAAYLNRPHGALLSFSPELFFRLFNDQIQVRPMKGTWPRGVNTIEDARAAELLRNDEKNRSEHVMIVDLLRNDLGQICEPGSVVVDDLFYVERYNTLLQMTSTISGILGKVIAPSGILRSLFPSGSITGAPKRRTMEIIRELEGQPRGVYTGAIGYFGPNSRACFNVAIRTVETDQTRLTLGVGGGITAGSVAEDEYNECLLKAAFLTRRRPPFSLIETMRCERQIHLLHLHLNRLADSASYFGIRYNADALAAELSELASDCREGVHRLRVELSETGRWTISLDPFRTTAWHGRLLLASESTSPKDIFLHHKTTNRSLYERWFTEARQSGFDEAVFTNEQALITEGAISNLFFHIRGEWLTPALLCGVLPGIERGSILANGSAREAGISIEDLLHADEAFACNALRGRRPIRSIEAADGSVIWRAPHNTADSPR